MKIYQLTHKQSYQRIYKFLALANMKMVTHRPKNQVWEIR